MTILFDCGRPTCIDEKYRIVECIQRRRLPVAIHATGIRISDAKSRHFTKRNNSFPRAYSSTANDNVAARLLASCIEIPGRFPARSRLMAYPHTLAGGIPTSALSISKENFDIIVEC